MRHNRQSDSSRSRMVIPTKGNEPPNRIMRYSCFLTASNLFACPGNRDEYDLVLKGACH